MRIALYPNGGRDHNFAVTRRLAQMISDAGAVAVLEEGIADGLPPGTPIVRDSYATCDVMMILGGDGTFLSAAHLDSARGLPMTGINLGSVGFLLEAKPEQMRDAVDKLVSGVFYTETRSFLSCSHKNGNGKSLLVDDVLNDVVVARGNIAKTVSVSIAIDGDEIGSVPGDGMIVATPTGSTAYSLSVGGPVLDPSIEAMVLSSICPHTLHNHSYVLSADSEIRLRLVSKEAEAFLTVDGRACYPMETGDDVIIRTSARKLSYIRLWEDAFFKTLPVKIQKRGVSQ